MLGLVVVLLFGGWLGPFVKKLFFSTASKFCIFSDALASLKIMFKIKSVFQSCFQDFKITEYKRVLLNVTECYRVLRSVTECYRVLQSVTEYYRVLQSITNYYRVLRVLQCFSSASTWTNFWACLIWFSVETRRDPCSMLVEIECTAVLKSCLQKTQCTAISGSPPRNITTQVTSSSPLQPCPSFLPLLVTIYVHRLHIFG